MNKLNLWEGDKIFFRLLEENIPFFSTKSYPMREDNLIVVTAIWTERNFYWIQKKV